MSEPRRLGPFALTELLASGGMAEVWRGVHRTSEEPVAVKLMRTDHAQKALWQSAFRAEVRAMARLNHPGVVRIHDYGTTEESSPSWQAGTPWLAMELVEGATLVERRPRLWHGVRDVLATLLDALAAAHAHDVVHRDLKPANVLVGNDGAIKLTDFGIAHAADRADLAESTTLDGGTPPFMAPEQFQGQFRDTGPWTDLYALGCLAWFLVCGRPPFGRVRSWMRAAMAHTRKPLPGLAPRMPLPEDLDAWLRRLLEKDPGHRFRCAADAHWALMQLGPAPEGWTDEPPTDEVPTAPRTHTLPWRPEGDFSDTQLPTQIDAPVPRVGLAGSGPMPALPRPPIPASWEDDIPELTDPLGGAGLGLFGLREFPLVGRRAERTALWSALRRAERTGRPQMVVLQGTAGTGKSRLAEWFLRRTRTLGAMQWSLATHAVPPGPGDGLAAMVRRDLALGGLEPEAARERIRRRLLAHGVKDADEIAAVQSMTAPITEEERQAGLRLVRFSAPVERYAVIARHLDRRSEGRVAGLWLDDGQWGLDALGLCRWMLDRHRGPLVIVATVREEALPERKGEARALEALLSREEVQRVALGPLAPDAQAELLQRWLGLSGELAEHVRERTSGNPLFAVQLVGDWVDRDLLEAGPDGFHLRTGTLAEIPDDLHAIWIARVERVVRGGPPSWRPALELAAALGMEVRVAEWEAICTASGLALPEGLVDALVRAKLARAFGREVWRFEHGMLRESIERDARERSRWVAHNLACVEWFREHGGPGRVGRHLFAADRWEEAFEPLMEDADATLLSTHLLRAEASLELAVRALDLAAVSGDDRRRARVRLSRSRAYGDRGEMERALTLGTEALSLARDNGWRDLEAQSLYALGEIYRDRPDVPRARELFARSLEAWEDVGDVRGRAGATHELGRVAIFAGDFDEARALHERSMALFRALGDPTTSGIANCHRALGELEIRREVDFDAARAHFREAGERYRSLGMRFGEASCLNGLAELARLRGDLEAAEAGYRRAAQLSDAMGHDGGDVMRINLGICQLQRGDPEVDALLEPVQQRMMEHARWGLVGFIDVLFLAARGLTGRFDDWTERAQRAERCLREARMIDRDASRFAHQAADRAASAGRSELAALARTVAVWQDEQLAR